LTMLASGTGAALHDLQRTGEPMLLLNEFYD
jgi:hypothetical protein